MLRTDVLARLLLIALVLAPGLARAAAGEKALSLGVDYSNWTITQDLPGDEDSVSASGAALAVDYARGWNDTLWLRASTHAGWYSLPGGSGWAAGGTVGITYAIDVLKYVPLVELGLGALYVSGDGIESELKPVVELGLGLAILNSRTFSYGFVARMDSFASQAVFLTIGPRITWRWGFF